MRALNDTEKAKVARFLLDATLSGAVYNVLLGTFIGKKASKDVNVAAAERIAVDLLNDAWRELEKCRAEEDTVINTITQVGL